MRGIYSKAELLMQRHQIFYIQEIACLQAQSNSRNVIVMTHETIRRWHDMGGQPAGDIDFDQHNFALWEKRVDALLVLTSGKGYFTVDGLRRVLEDMGEDAFETMTYYERWVQSVNQNMLEAGAYSLEELSTKMAEVTARGETYGDCAGGGE